MPIGLDFDLYDDDNYEDRKIVLKGTGSTEWIADLETAEVRPGVVEHPGNDADEELDFNDKATSGRFVGVPPSGSATMLWDLDADGVVGETGQLALRGDEVGSSPSFSAASLDGPTQFEVLLVVQSGGQQAASIATIDVLNVAPTVAVESVIDETGAEVGVDVPVALVGLNLEIEFVYSDSVVLDTHTALVDWGDGTQTDLGAIAGGSGSTTHAFMLPGDHEIAVVVTDDDGGIGEAIRAVRVVDPAGAVGSVVEALDALPPDLHIDAALDKLRGDNNGADANGAVDLLHKENGNAALNKLSQAVALLEEAEENDPSLDLADLEALLALVAKAVAVDAVNDAANVASKPSEFGKVADAQGLILQGDAALAGTKYVPAIDLYQEAVRKVTSIG